MIIIEWIMGNLKTLCIIVAAIPLLVTGILFSYITLDEALSRYKWYPSPFKRDTSEDMHNLDMACTKGMVILGFVNIIVPLIVISIYLYYTDSNIMDMVKEARIMK